MPFKQGILERLNDGEVIIGDGGMTHALEKRCYVKAGVWTPECVVEHPEAVRQLHREFLRAGADVIQAFTFAMQDKPLVSAGYSYKWDEISHAGSILAKEVSDEGEFALSSGSLCETGSLFIKGLASKEEIKQRFRDQVKIFVDTGMDLLIAEYISHVQEAEWMVEVMKESGKPVAVTMAISREGDRHGVLPGECAVRLVRAGADIIGVNCRFDPERSLDTIALMQEAIQREGLKTHWMVQPLGYWCPDAGPSGFTSIPECTLALEPRVLTRIEAHKFARKAYNMGVRYIGGCCGFEPYHIRALAEELSKERGRLPPGSDKSCLWGEALVHHAEAQVARRATREYWEKLVPATGRPFSPAFAVHEDTWKTEKKHE
ncbi:S-methylmethionine--homocysteine S-methyltransferase BHMT2 isoform X1 [Nematostella vectensis]|uniref:S-methylmethionine--homocysteine S-methyltransferase BHMT2 isoform X1 n=2 Tax=Nematostella vectensis TaxID=45351 RepID=UPI0020775359|nr:S-methylmethionine--homocysteine S-methyltransferase BHMT2 isoform X1 [Nematostella vectensis]